MNRKERRSQKRKKRLGYTRISGCQPYLGGK